MDGRLELKLAHHTPKFVHYLDVLELLKQRLRLPP
jgi:hypothetical protein